MAVKLTDKEVSALAKKLAAKGQKVKSAARAELIKKKLPEAKKYMAIINGLPPEVLRFLYSNRYSAGITPQEIAASLVPETSSDDSRAIQGQLEADVILAAHDVTTMAALCKKLDI